MKIGFFDSGLGGLTVMKAVVNELPQYDYEFYGDTANLPYGEKSEEEVYELSKKAVTHLFERGSALVVIACNTASAETLRKLQDTFLPTTYPNRRILGVIIPMVECVIALGSKKTLLLATTRTISSKKYDKEFAKHKNQPELISVATPTLVPLIESNKLDNAVEDALTVIKNFSEKKIDTVILGCTHYGLLREKLHDTLKEGISILSADQIIPLKLKYYLEVHSEIESTLSRCGTRNIYLSQHGERYDALISDLLGGSLLKE